jgi:Tfp pilus assembly protein PilN
MAAQNPSTPGQVPKTQPPSSQPRGLSRRIVALWLVVVGLAIGLIPLYLVANSARGEVARLNGDLEFVQQQVTIVPTAVPEVQHLLDSLAQVDTPAKHVQVAYATIMASRTDWPQVMTAIGNYDPGQLTISSLTQPVTHQIMLTGQAVNEAAVTAYVRSLQQSNLFANVTLQSIQVMTSAVVLATLPGALGTPTLAVITTSIPPVGDTYEVDDFQPKDIVVGVPQRHTFYPVYDVDKIKFLAKAGRFYRVFTSDLVPGVDTFLSVNVGGIVYSNDDRQPGELSSEVTFQVAPDADRQVIVTVTNRGQYGPDMGYTLAVEEVIPTPTPTGLPTGTPTVTPTSTPDQRDRYEPDDTEPKPIAVGETQRHTFFPDGDIDEVWFLAKSGRYYRVSTADLTLGVDTALQVRVGANTYTNDDRQPGDPSSEVAFQVPVGPDLQVVVTVRNRGLYGPDKAYSINVEEYVPTPTTIPPATATGTPTVTPIPTDTGTPTATPTVTPIPTDTGTPTATPTVTPIPTDTGTPTVTSTPTATETPTVTTSSGVLPLFYISWVSPVSFMAFARPAQMAVGHMAVHHVNSLGHSISFDPQGVEFVIVLELRVK